MFLLLYLFIGFIVFFFMWKKYEEKFKVKIAPRPGSSYPDNSWMETQEFWIMLLVPLFWPLSLPGLFIWRILEIIYTNQNKNKKEDGETIR